MRLHDTIVGILMDIVLPYVAIVGNPALMQQGARSTRPCTCVCEIVVFSEMGAALEHLLANTAGPGRRQALAQGPSPCSAR